MEAQKITLALIDDHNLARDTFAAFLRSLGYEVVLSCSSAEDFLEKWLQMKLKPQLCIIDISMPNMTGFELLEEIKKIDPSQKCLMFSLFGGADNIATTIKLLGEGFLSKDCGAEELKEAIDTIVLRHGTYYRTEKMADVHRALLNPDRLDHSFTVPQKRYLSLVGKCLTDKEMAIEMKLQMHDVFNLKAQLFNKLGRHSVMELLAYAITNGYFRYSDYE